MPPEMPTPLRARQLIGHGLLAHSHIFQASYQIEYDGPTFRKNQAIPNAK
jgi:hypothetical protein